MIVSILEEAEMWDDVYIAIAAHLTLRELYSTLIERALITEEEARESGTRFHRANDSRSFQPRDAQQRIHFAPHVEQQGRVGKVRWGANWFAFGRRPLHCIGNVSLLGRASFTN